MTKDAKTDKDEKVLETARERFERSMEASEHNRRRMREDIRFAAASPDDPWQWDEATAKDRKTTMRPMLTINKMPQHIRQVTNDIRQNRPSIRYRPADDGADVEVADILMGLVRHIEANSDADIAYDTASEHQVTHGLGYIRVLADYISEDSFDQDIFIERVKDPFKCYDDPDIEDPAGADRKWFFIEDWLSEDDFKAQYPDADPVDWDFTDGEWYSKSEKRLRIAEYFEVEDKETDLLLWANGQTSFRGDPMPQGVYMGENPVKSRKSQKRAVVWRKLTGNAVLETKEFPCKYIPVARVIGNEWEVDGKTYISGLVRNSKDSQRMYNVAQTAIVERVMQAPKSPWLAAAESVEGHEKAWQTANTANHSFLPWNHIDEQGNPIPKPERTQAATVETGLNQIAMGAADDIKSETGQYDASLGQKSNETSGRAILARQREGDIGTYHYVDNLGRAVRHVGRIVLDMVPRVLDTRRIARIMGEDGAISQAVLDPQSPQAYSETRGDDGAIQKIFNPNIGTYDAYTTSGPSFTTRRIEAAEAMKAIAQGNPEIWSIAGDLMVKSMDWPGAEDLAKRFKLALLPAVQQSLDKEGGQADIPPEVQAQMQAMQQEIQGMQEAGQELVKELQATKAKADSKEVDGKKLLIEAYKAETDRIQALGTAMTPEMVQGLVMQTLQSAMQQPDPLPEEMPMPPPPMQEMPPEQPPTGGFSLPEGQM